MKDEEETGETNKAIKKSGMKHKWRVKHDKQGENMHNKTGSK